MARLRHSLNAPEPLQLAKPSLYSGNHFQVSRGGSAKHYKITQTQAAPLSPELLRESALGVLLFLQRKEGNTPAHSSGTETQRRRRPALPRPNPPTDTLLLGVLGAASLRAPRTEPGAFRCLIPRLLKRPAPKSSCT